MLSKPPDPSQSFGSATEICVPGAAQHRNSCAHCSFWAPHPPDGGGMALRACRARASAGPPAAQNLLAVPVTTRVDDAADAMTAVLGPKDLERFRDGSHCDLHRVLGSHRSDAAHVRFAVWAPNAERVSVVGDFNGVARGRVRR